MILFTALTPIEPRMHTCSYNCDCDPPATELPFEPDPQHSSTHGSVKPIRPAPQTFPLQLALVLAIPAWLVGVALCVGLEAVARWVVVVLRGVWR